MTSTELPESAAGREASDTAANQPRQRAWQGRRVKEFCVIKWAESFLSKPDTQTVIRQFDPRWQFFLRGVVIIIVREMGQISPFRANAPRRHQGFIQAHAGGAALPAY